MKNLIIAMAALLVSVSAYGQGQVVFNNRVIGSVVAQVTLGGTTIGIQDGVGAPGTKWEAQLWGGPAGGPLEALLPKTTFRTGAGAGYVVAVDVTLAKVAPGATASLQMKAFSTDGFYQGQSKVFNVTLGGGLNPPAALVGLEAFTLQDNFLPTISAIPSQKLRLDQPSPVIPFSVSDVETSADQLLVTVSSFNKTLVPDAQIILGGSGAQRELVIVPAVQQLGTTTITVTVTDAKGAYSSVSFDVTVTGVLPPVIISSLKSQTIVEGANVTFTVVASGTSPFKYQWQRNGTAINGATSSILVLPNVRRSDAGEYRIAVSNDAGQVLSDPAVLTVLGGGPPNDNFLDRIRLTGLTVVVEGSNADATRQAGEPNHGGNQATASVWWSWTSPKYGSVTISTTGSAIDTLLVVYTGASLDTLKQVAVNDDDPDGGTTSRVTFVTSVAPGTAYQIAVDSFGGVAGNIRLKIDFTPVGPPLRSEASGRNLVLSWPAIAPGFSVETTDDLTAPNWIPGLLTAVIIGDSYSAKVPISGASKYYRLRGQ